MHFLLHHTVEQSAKRFPEKAAFICGNQSVTFSELDAQTNQLANLLLQKGVQKGDRVGVYLGRTLESAIAIFGIMKAGAAYVPLDPTAPAGRTAFLVNDCGIQHLVTNPGNGKTLPRVLAEGTLLRTIIGLKADLAVETTSWEEVQAMPESESPAVRVLDTDLAYIMYTSGTTGVPKGIMHTHRSGLAYAKLSAALYDLSENDRVGNHASLFFDISTFGYFSAPLVGATTILTTEAHTMMPASLGQLIEQEKITLWYSVPLAIMQLLQFGGAAERDFSSLRWVLFGGEPFPPKPLRMLMELWPNCRFCNVYGPAEVNQCTFYHLPEPPQNDDPIPLGEVWSNTEALIVNELDEPVANGQTGELLIRTATMMAGYWKQPELTQRALYSRTGNGGVPEIFYRTGDLVSLRADGNMLFWGRKDRQIKVRGYRVELEEIVNVLQRHPAVDEAAVFTVKAEDGTLAIEASIVAKPGCECSQQEIMAHVANHLPRYAQPRNIVIVSELPRTTAGKINIQQLQEAATKPGI